MTRSEESARASKRAGKRSRTDLIASLLSTIAEMAKQDLDLLDFKIADAALREMTEAFMKFSPYRRVRKVTIFGSARTSPAHPLYNQARDLARRLAEAGWMVVTGAGPGIMAAGVEGAGPENALGVNIRLPHEQAPNAFIANDPKLVQMRYFFTRKLMLMKESHAFVCLPGGFGTLDETFELLTLLQTGKGVPAPVVLLEVPGIFYWRKLADFLKREVLGRGYIDAGDFELFRITESVEEATSIILSFYSNYHSMRWVGSWLVLRLEKVPSKERLEELSQKYAFMIGSQGIREVEPFPVEVEDGDCLDLKRIAMRFDKVHYGDLHRLIKDLNAIQGP